MFLRQALRYRWSQALVLGGISLLIGTCAMIVFAPWFARAVEQTVMTETLTRQRLTAAWQLEARPPRGTAGAITAARPEDMARLIPAALNPLFTQPVYGVYADVTPIVRRPRRTASY